MSESETVEALVLDLLEWVGPGPRPYAEMLDAWRTSCPRLAVWEEAHGRGFLRRFRGEAGAMLEVTEAGAQHLRMHRRRPGHLVPA